MRRRYKITNIGFLGGTKKEIVEFILESNKDSGACIITSAGLRQCILAATIPHFRNVLDEFDIVTVQGLVAKSVPDGKYFDLEACSGWDILEGVMSLTRGDTNAKHYFVGADKVILQSLADKYTKAGNSVVGYGVIDREQNSLSSVSARGDIKFIWLLGKSPWIENLCLNLRQHFPGIKVIAINS